MISAKKLSKLTKKWQKLAAIRGKRITLPKTFESVCVSSNCSASSTAEKGHFVVYSSDQRRFVLPMEYLKNEIVRELFKLAEEEFGLSSNEPFTLPCDSVFVEYIVSLIKRSMTEDVEKALLTSLASGHCSSFMNLDQESTDQHLLICSC